MSSPEKVAGFTWQRVGRRGSSDTLDLLQQQRAGEEESTPQQPRPRGELLKPDLTEIQLESNQRGIGALRGGLNHKHMALPPHLGCQAAKDGFKETLAHSQGVQGSRSTAGADLGLSGLQVSPAGPTLRPPGTSVGSASPELICTPTDGSTLPQGVWVQPDYSCGLQGIRQAPS